MTRALSVSHFALSRIIFCLTIAAASLICSCNNSRNDAASESINLIADYTPTHASGFKIERIDGGKSTILSVTSPWQGASTNDVSQLLIRRDDEPVPAGFTGAIVNQSAKRIVAMSSTNVAMLDAIDAIDAVAGVSGLRFINTPNLDSHKVTDVGNEADADYETIVALNPDLVLIYGIASPSVMEAKLSSLHIPYIYIGDYLEQSPLGKAEWIVAMGEITGSRDKAIARFKDTVERYNNLKESVDTLRRRPIVMLNAPYGESWFMPDADNYIVRLIEDAGGEYVYADNHTQRSVAVSDEESLMLASRSDIWLNPGQFTTLDALCTSLPRFSNVKAVKSRRVFNNNLATTPAGGNDFFESGAVYPDRVLEDLIEIINPTDRGYEPYYFRQLR